MKYLKNIQRIRQSIYFKMTFITMQIIIIMNSNKTITSNCTVIFFFQEKLKKKLLLCHDDIFTRKYLHFTFLHFSREKKTFYFKLTFYTKLWRWWDISRKLYVKHPLPNQTSRQKKLVFSTDINWNNAHDKLATLYIYIQCISI